jgi:uncharacterized protein YycO
VEYKSGDLILCKNGSFADHIIEDIEGGIYYHCAVIVDNTRVVQAVWNGVHYANISDFTNYDIFTCNSLTDKQRRTIVKYVEDRVGWPYDYKLLVWEAERYLTHMILPYHEYHSVICSVLGQDAYNSIRVDLCPWIEYGSPVDISKSKLLTKGS